MFQPTVSRADDGRPAPNRVSVSISPRAAFGFAAGGLVGDAPRIEAPKVNIAILNTRGEMREWMESAEGQRVAFDAVSRRTMEMGVRG